MSIVSKFEQESILKFSFCANFCIIRACFLLLLAGAPVLAQTPVTTWHYNNARSSVNTTEVLLTPSNVNIKTFGKLFTMPVDGFIVGQPLYLPGIRIPGQGTYNVVYVATMHESVYAFDADAPHAGPLWTTSLLASSPAGATPVPTSVQKNGGGTGWTEVGVISTPVIDPVAGTIYVVNETYESGKVVHRLHALDVTNGQERVGSPVTITATFTLNGTVSTFADLYQINRPGLLLANGHVYIAFGSNCCNGYSQGWVMSYNASTLQQEGTFDAQPGKTLASIWQKGAGLSADSNGNIYAETGESKSFAPGANLPESVFKLSQVGTTLSLSDWFTPYNYLYLSEHDLDLAQAVLILPDQPGPVPHEAIAIGKEGTAADSSIPHDGLIDLTSKMTGDGSLDWDVPAGKWTILRMGYSLTGARNRPAPPTGSGLEVDKLSRKDVEAYFHGYTDPLADALGPLVGKSLRYVMMDSWEAGMQNWTDEMLSEFQARRGYDPRPYLPVLTGRVVGSADVSDRFLWDFRRTLADMFAENHYGTMAKLLKQRGIGIYAEAAGVSMEVIEDTLLNKSKVDIPMGEFWVRALHPELQYYVDVRGAASASHVYGKNLVATESFTGGGYEAPFTLKKVGDYWFAQGVNRIVFHTSAHQPLDTKPGNTMVGTHINRNIKTSAGQLIERLGLEQANASQHLTVLRSKQIVVSRKEGNQVFYSLRDPVLIEVLDVLKRYFNSQLSQTMSMLKEIRKEKAAAKK